jgi:hypothetical protein
MKSKFENFDFLRDCQKVETEYWTNDSILPWLSVNLFNKFGHSFSFPLWKRGIEGDFFLCLLYYTEITSCDRICRNRVLGCDQYCDSLTKKKRPFSGAGPAILSLGELHFGKLYKNLA